MPLWLQPDAGLDDTREHAQSLRGGSATEGMPNDMSQVFRERDRHIKCQKRRVQRVLDDWVSQ